MPLSLDRDGHHFMQSVITSRRLSPLHTRLSSHRRCWQTSMTVPRDVDFNLGGGFTSRRLNTFCVVT